MFMSKKITNLCFRMPEPTKIDFHLYLVEVVQVLITIVVLLKQANLVDLNPSPALYLAFSGNEPSG